MSPILAFYGGCLAAGGSVVLILDKIYVSTGLDYWIQFAILSGLFFIIGVIKIIIWSGLESFENKSWCSTSVLDNYENKQLCYENSFLMTEKTPLFLPEKNIPFNLFDESFFLNKFGFLEGNEKEPRITAVQKSQSERPKFIQLFKSWPLYAVLGKILYRNISNFSR